MNDPLPLSPFDYDLHRAGHSTPEQPAIDWPRACAWAVVWGVVVAVLVVAGMVLL